LGRLARLAFVALLAVSFQSIADQGGPASFQGQSNLTEPSLLFLDAVMLLVFVSLVGVLAISLGHGHSAGRWSIIAVVVSAAVVAGSAALSQLAHGSVWYSPLSDVVWWFDALMLLQTMAALLIAVVIGLPGCELSVWPVLIGRTRGERSPTTPVACIIGLHLLDGWEASRRRSRNQV
jgi:hypothetical protein